MTIKSMNGTAKLILMFVTAISVTYSITSTVFNRGVKADVIEIHGQQKEDGKIINRHETRLRLLKQQLNSIEEAVKETNRGINDIRGILFKPTVQLYSSPEWSNDT